MLAGIYELLKLHGNYSLFVLVILEVSLFVCARLFGLCKPYSDHVTHNFI